MAKRENETTAALKRAQLFRTLAPAALARLALNATAVNLPRGKQLCRSGERCPGLYLVVGGRIMLSIGAPRGASKVIELIGPGGHIGLAAAVLGAPETVTAQTLADSRLLLIPCEALLDCAASNPGFALQLVAELSRQVCGLISDIEAFSLHSGRERVAGYLLQIASAGSARPRPVTLPAKKSIIASRLSLTPEYFSRMLHELIAAGAIAVNGRQVTILDPNRLRNPGH
ncbi:MAG: Crp/Fnr family transcriptional regulator [Betaproteobacteria bacterium]|nr:Crp/Fnr family transcriptional regulator [Betaproteobacteria bacterium]